MLPSDLSGLFGSIALAVPAIRDQYWRFHATRQERQAGESAIGGLRRHIRDAFEVKRNKFDAFDSLLALTGTALLMVSFGLKLANA